MVNGEGGRNAAFLLFLLAVGAFGFGGSIQYPLAVLRAGAFGAALLFLWGRRNGGISLSSYPLLAGGFVLLAAGHAFSSVYVWVSLQHAINMALGAVLLAWATLWFREEGDAGRERAFAAIGAAVLAQIALALFQRFAMQNLRPQGTFGDPNYLSEFLAGAGILLMARFAGKDDSRRHRAAAGALALLSLAAALSLARSRGVLLSAVPAAGFLFAWRFGWRKGAALLAVAGAPGLALLGWGTAGRFFAGNVYDYSRWVIWKSALRTFAENPFGVGLGGFQYLWYATQTPVAGAFRRYGKSAVTAHSEYLEVLSGLGVLGFALFLAVLAGPFLQAARGWREIPPGRRWAAAGAVGGLILSGSHALFNSNFHEIGIVCFDAVLLGVLLSVLPAAGRRVVTLPAWAVRAGIAVCAALAAVTAATVFGVFAFERGEARLRRGDLAGAERAFLLASSVDPLRAAYPDALSSVHYRRGLKERQVSGGTRRAEAMHKTALLWEDRARTLNPSEPKYPLRLSYLFTESYRARGEPSDARMALLLAGSALRINPYGVEALLHRSSLLASLGRREEAVKDLEKAVSLEPNFCRGYAKLAEVAGASDPVEASAWAAKAETCRKTARHLPLEDFEKWLVEPPEGK